MLISCCTFWYSFTEVDITHNPNIASIELYFLRHVASQPNFDKHKSDKLCEFCLISEPSWEDNDSSNVNIMMFSTYSFSQKFMFLHVDIISKGI